MFKLVVLSTLLAVAVARPSLIDSHAVVYSAPAAAVAVHEPVLAKVGAVVKSIPTAVSHQSQSVVHSSAQVVEDVVAPVVKTSVVQAPVLHSAAIHHVAATPLLHTAPYAHYVSPLSHLHAASPLTYAAHHLW